MIDFLEPLLGPYPFDRLRQRRRARSGALLLARDPDDVNYPEDAGIDEVTVVHELAHQWFGDAVTVADGATSGWPRASPTYVEILWPNRASPAAFDAAMRDLYASVVKKQVGPAVVSRPEDIFADNTYERGALTLLRAAPRGRRRPPSTRSSGPTTPPTATGTPPRPTSSTWRRRWATRRGCRSCCSLALRGAGPAPAGRRHRPGTERRVGKGRDAAHGVRRR